MATYYDWDEIEDNIDEEYDENGTTIVDFTTEPTLYGSVVSQNRNGDTRFYHFDGMGNTTELTDESGNVTDTRRYSAFGDVTASFGTTTLPLEFAGEHGYYCDSGAATLYVRHRWLTRQGRWLSPDPAIANRPYMYCDNRPLYLIDPSGLKPIIPLPPKPDPNIEQWLRDRDKFAQDMQAWLNAAAWAKDQPCWFVGVRNTQVIAPQKIQMAAPPACPFVLGLNVEGFILAYMERTLDSLSIDKDICPAECPCKYDVQFGATLTGSGNVKFSFWWKLVRIGGRIQSVAISSAPEPGFRGPCDVDSDFTISLYVGFESGTCQSVDPPIPPGPRPVK